MVDGRIFECANFCDTSSTRISHSHSVTFGTLTFAVLVHRYIRDFFKSSSFLLTNSEKENLLFFQTVYDPMYISVYNLFYTSLPVLALGIFEQDVSDKDSIEFPKLYTPGLTNELFNVKEFMRSVMHGIFSSLVTFIIPWGTYRDGIGPDGLVLSDHMTLASVMAAVLILDNTAQVSRIDILICKNQNRIID